MSEDITVTVKVHVFVSDGIIKASGITVSKDITPG